MKEGFILMKTVLNYEVTILCTKQLSAVTRVSTIDDVILKEIKS